MDQETKQKIAEIFQRNLENKISADLANGMLQSIFQVLEQQDKNIKEEQDTL